MSILATVLLSLSFSTVVSAIPLVERQDNGTAPEPAPADPGVDCSPSSSTGLKPECWKACELMVMLWGDNKANEGSGYGEVHQ
jgi:hypothetical protein